MDLRFMLASGQIKPTLYNSKTDELVKLLLPNFVQPKTALEACDSHLQIKNVLDSNRNYRYDLEQTLNA